MDTKSDRLLGDSANGQGVDAVWRANRHNERKMYAIVEAKARGIKGVGVN